MLVLVVIPFTILTVFSYQIYFNMKSLKDRLHLRRGMTVTNGHGGHTNHVLVNGKAGEQNQRMLRRQDSRSNVLQNQAASREVNLSMILIFTSVTFLILHIPRSVDSLYEAIAFQAQLVCEKKSRLLEYTKPWRHVVFSINELFLVNIIQNFLLLS